MIPPTSSFRVKDTFMTSIYDVHEDASSFVMSSNKRLQSLHFNFSFISIMMKNVLTFVNIDNYFMAIMYLVTFVKKKKKRLQTCKRISHCPHCAIEIKYAPSEK